MEELRQALMTRLGLEIERLAKLESRKVTKRLKSEESHERRGDWVQRVKGGRDTDRQRDGQSHSEEIGTERHGETKTDCVRAQREASESERQGSRQQRDLKKERNNTHRERHTDTDTGEVSARQMERHGEDRETERQLFTQDRNRTM